MKFSIFHKNPNETNSTTVHLHPFKTCLPAWDRAWGMQCEMVYSISVNFIIWISELLESCVLITAYLMVLYSSTPHSYLTLIIIICVHSLWNYSSEKFKVKPLSNCQKIATFPYLYMSVLSQCSLHVFNVYIIFCGDFLCFICGAASPV